MPIKRLFSDWNKEELEDTFGLIRRRTLPAFDEWGACSAAQRMDDVETVVVSRLKELLIDHADAWNEAELTEYFIGPILSLVNFNTPFFTIFSERTITGAVGDYELSGEPDAVIATGMYSPKIPYFCFHEYKKENEPRGDPAAQAFSALLAALQNALTNITLADAAQISGAAFDCESATTRRGVRLHVYRVRTV